MGGIQLIGAYYLSCNNKAYKSARIIVTKVNNDGNSAGQQWIFLMTPWLLSDQARPQLLA